MGFFELLLIAVVSLLVVGPERMPEAVRSVMMTVGRLKRLFSDARDEVEKHIGADEIRQQLHNESVLDNIAKMKLHEERAEKIEKPSGPTVNE